jgi:predicted RNA polymerase sigma factor
MAPAHRAIEAVWRVEAPRLIGGLMRLTRDVARAEDLAQEALVAALERWPEAGIPPESRRLAHDRRPQPGPRRPAS